MVKNKYLFAFENNRSAIVETKVLEQPEGTHPSKVYFWLLIDKAFGKVTPLNFVSMQKEPSQVRIFEEGQLEFDSQIAKFNDAQFEAINKEIKGSNLDNLVLDYLNNIIS